MQTIQKNSWQAWCACFRPKTLLISATPVIAGIALAFGETGTFRPMLALPTIAVAVLLQMISNMENDVGYTIRKAERSNRKGFPRATCEGWLSVQDVQRAIKILAAAMLAIAAPLIWIGGWPLAVIAVASLLTAYCYMGGPKPIAYTPFGELLVLVFFGLCAVGGTYFLQTGNCPLIVLMDGAAFGLIGSAVLAVNNFRDRIHDKSIGRQTLAVLLPEKAFLALYWVMMLFPFVLVGWTVSANTTRWPMLVVLLALGKAARLASSLGSCKVESFNAHMLATVKLETVFGLLLASGAVIEGAMRWM